MNLSKASPGPSPFQIHLISNLRASRILPDVRHLMPCENTSPPVLHLLPPPLPYKMPFATHRLLVHDCGPQLIIEARPCGLDPTVPFLHTTKFHICTYHRDGPARPSLSPWLVPLPHFLPWVTEASCDRKLNLLAIHGVVMVV